MPAATAQQQQQPGKKYKLRSVANVDDPKLVPCAFFTSPQGCRSGNACKFLHDANNVGKLADTGNIETTTTAAIADTGKKKSVNTKQVKFRQEEYLNLDTNDVSSESDDDGEIVERNITILSSQQNNQKRKNTTKTDSPFPSAEEIKKAKDEAAKSKNSKKQNNPANPFALPPSKKQKTTVSTNITGNNSLVVPANNSHSSSNTSVAPVTEYQQQQKKQQPKRSKSLPLPNTSNIVDFRSMNLPISSFVMPGSNKSLVVNEELEASTSVTKSKAGATSNKASGQQTLQSQEQQTVSISPPKSKSVKSPALPLPSSTPSGRKWASLVRKTREHPRYNNLYDLSKYMEQDTNAGYSIDTLWIKTVPFNDPSKQQQYNSNKGQYPQVIAIDCEMCETMDPVTQNKDHRALCRVSIVDVETDEVLLDSLVKPAWPVTNYRTWVNGITAEHLENVQFTLRHAQAYMMALCTNETVIIGHAVHNDLAALRVEHPTVIDSACLYNAIDSETAMVSLRDIVSHVLHIEMPDKHDSVNDARMAYQIVNHYRVNDGKVEQIPRTVNLNKQNNSGGQHPQRISDYESQLFVHRIPKNVCDEEQLLQMFLLYTNVKPIKVDDIEFTNSNSNGSATPDHMNTSGKTHVYFSSGRHGNLAFDSLDGKAIADTSGRLQKKVFLKNGSYIRIRKMAFEPTPTTATTTIVNDDS